MHRSTCALVATLCLGSGPASSAQQPASQPPTPFRSGVEGVTLDVSVVDGEGRPIGGLAPDDFIVSVAGRARRVVSATFVDASATSPADAPSGSPGLARLPLSTNDGAAFGRLVVFVVDQNTLDQGEVRQVASAASRFIDRLTPADRSALVLMPVGSGVPFTADHGRVYQALLRASGLAATATDLRSLGLEEVRAIAAGDFRALQNAASRECPSEASGQAAGAGGATAGPGGTTSDGQSRGSGYNPGASMMTSMSSDSCTRRLQFDAQSIWHQAHSTSLSSLAALRTVLNELKKTPGEKSVVIISGGWPLELRESGSELAPLASLAADAQATIFTLYAESAEGSAERRSMSTTSLADQTVRRWPLQTIAGMTGGNSYRADIGAASVFDRLNRELSGYYRLGIEQDATDIGAKPRPMKVEVTRQGTTVRARERFVVPSYADRDHPARLEEALISPVPSTGLGLRLTSYLAADPDTPSRVKVLLVGDAFRLQPGEVNLQLVVRDATGKALSSGGRSLGEATTDHLPFTTSFTLDPGRYAIRVAVVDAAGMVGSVDHLVDVRRTPLGAWSAGDLLLGKVPASAGDEAGFLLDGVRQDERLALQLDLVGDRVAESDVVFELASSDDGPALITVEASHASGSSGSALTQAVTDVRLLPVGYYVARARVSAGANVVGVVTRPFVVTAPAAVRSGAGEPAPDGSLPAPASGFVGRAGPTGPPFSVDHVLAAPVLGAFLDRVASRSDVASPSVGPLIDRLRTTPPEEVRVPDDVATEAPAVASFVDGLAKLARAELDPAAQAFRAALRTSSDFYPAMVYLGACFAAGGKDAEAAGAWQTALIKQADVAPLHLLLIDALERLGRHDAALDAIERARRHWPDDGELTRRFIVAALSAGQYQEGLKELDELQPQPEDEAALALGLRVLYEAITTSRPLESLEADRARMLRYAEAYHRLNGPSAALVDMWVAAATRQR